MSLIKDCIEKETQRNAAELFVRAQAGDLTARDSLFSQNQKLCFEAAKRYQTSAELEDLISIAYIGLLKAIDTFDTERGHTFATYAFRVIQNEIGMYFRSANKYTINVTARLEDNVESTHEETHPLQLGDTIANEIDDIEELLDNTSRKQLIAGALDYAKEQMSPKHFAIFKKYFDDTMSGIHIPHQATAGQIGVSRSYVSHIVCEGRDFMKQYILAKCPNYRNLY